MTTGKRFFCQLLIAAVLLFAAHATALAADDFGMIVKNIESRYNAKRKKIPFLGVAGFLVKIVRPAGVKSFKFALFENHDFAPGPQDAEFEQAVRKSLNRKWQPMLQSRSRLEGNRTYIYSQPSGKDIKLLSVTFTRQQAIVVEAKVNPESLMKFMDQPEIMGFSLSGVMGNGPRLADLGNTGGSINRGSSNRRRGEPDAHSLESLRDENYEMPDSPTRSKPTLGTGSKDETGEARPAAGVEQPGSSARARAEEGVLKLEARLVNINVRATDRAGNPLGDLRKEDFTIFEDGVRQDIFSFEPVDSPISLVLLLDLSGSTINKRKVMAEAAKKFVDSLGREDRIAIAAFTRDFVVVSDFTSDRRLLKQRLDKIDDIQGGTAFYDAMWQTLDMLDRVEEARKAIVVLTDGLDNSISSPRGLGTRHTFDELLARAEEQDATIYPIRTGNESGLVKIIDDIANDRKSLKMNKQVQGRIKEALNRPYEVAREQLDALAEQTGGKVFEAASEDDLDGVYEQVARELRLLYGLSYAPRNTDNDGRFRKISVEINREGAVVKSRRGYYAR
ncbi:MAG: VWA domain-containing protein [Blastocatellia bacterium]|nr:VWA domain-containing protein [Blastocatellia bacterium]